MKFFHTLLTILATFWVITVPAADDDHWDPQFGPPGADGLVNDIVCSGGKVYLTGAFYSAGEAGCVGIASWDGANWSGYGSGFAMGQNPIGLAIAVRGAEVFVGGAIITNISGVKVRSLARWDGSAWADLGGDGNGIIYSILATEQDVFVSGVFSRIGGVSATNIARWDGANWHALGDGLYGYTNSSTAGAITLARAANGDVIAGGNFRYAGGVEVNNIARWNGSQWQALGGGVFNGGSGLVVNDVKVLNNDVYVAGVFKSAGGVIATNIARWDGAQWHAMGGGPFGSYYALAIAGTNVYTAGNFTNIGGVAAKHVARWTGSAWAPLAPGTAGEVLTSVSCLATDGTNLYAGGDFIQAGTAGTLAIAKWNGSEWAALTGPKTKGIWLGGTALAVEGNAVYVGGSGVRIAGGVKPNAVAHFNGSDWDNMGGGLTGGSGTVGAIVKAGGNVYVGGNFSNAGGVPVNNIAYWDGANWHAMGSGLNNSVNALCFHNGQLFAGGSFTARGNNSASLHGIARWDGVDWVDVPVISSWRINNVINAMVSDGVNLYVGGNYFIGWFEPFPPYDGASVENIGYWDGSNWWPLGLGLSNTVNSLALVGSDLYAGGSFTKAGGNVNLLRLAKWNGSAWSQVSGGFGSGTVSGLAASGATLYVGGSFTNAIGLTGTNRILKWTGSQWQTLGSGVSRISPSTATVGKIAVSGDDVYMLGSFTYAGGRPSAGLARWNETLSFVPPEIQLVNAGFDGLGRFHFDVSGLSSGTFTIQAATALTNWTDIHWGAHPNTNFTDVDSPTIPTRAYRVKTP
jgi:hypothetical protein